MNDDFSITRYPNPLNDFRDAKFYKKTCQKCQAEKSNGFEFAQSPVLIKFKNAKPKRGIVKDGFSAFVCDDCLAAVVVQNQSEYCKAVQLAKELSK